MHLFNTCNKQISRGFIRDKRRESNVIMVFSKSSGCHRLERPQQEHYQPFPSLPIASPFVSSRHRISPANLSRQEPGRYKKKSVSI